MAKRIVVAFSLGILFIIQPTLATAMIKPAVNIFEKATANRFPDPVMIQGKTFPDLVDGALSNYRVYGCHQGNFEPIRFQIDEMTEKGDWIFPYGKQSNKTLSNGTLDTRDLLLFMAHDAGDRVPREAWPKNAAKGRELEVIDPIDQSRAWAYLFYFEKDPPPLCPLPDYVDYDYDTETIEGTYWKISYVIREDGKHVNLYDGWQIFPKGGGTGENFLDQFKIRSTAKFFFGRISLTYNEKKIHSYVINAWIQGPIRVIRRLETIVKGPFNLTLIRALSDIYYYETMLTCPIHFSFPFKLERVLTSLHVRLGLDYAPAVKNSMYYNNNNTQGVRINGKMDETEANFNPKADRWRVMTGKWGTVMSRNVLTPEAENYLQIVQGITDDETLMNPPERFPGSIGWTWQDWRISQLPGGSYTFYLEFYTPPNYKPGTEVVYLNYMDHPLKVKVADQIFANQARLFGKPSKDFK